MGINRRDFLKGFGGLCAVAGMSASSGLLAVQGAEASSGSQGEEKSSDKSTVRWGMLIDTRKMSEADIKKCAEACHSNHNVPDYSNVPQLGHTEVPEGGNVKDEIKWIWPAKPYQAFPSMSTSQASTQFEHGVKSGEVVAVLCNHCENPPCVRVCPTKATFKNKQGITMMDMHRCIGCRFCMAGCPYGARSFNWREPRMDKNTLWGGRPITAEYPTRERGVVEKCLFCHERIEKSGVPASGQDLLPEQVPFCVKAAPAGAIVFGNLKDPNSRIREALRANHTVVRKSEAGTNPSVFYII